MCAFAYAVALVIYQIGSAINGNVNVVGLIAAICVLGFVGYMLFKPYKESERLSQEVKVS
jgi:ferrous iron transport protein B